MDSNNSYKQSKSEFLKERDKISRRMSMLMLPFCQNSKAEGRCQHRGEWFSSGSGCVFFRLYAFVSWAALWLHPTLSKASVQTCALPHSSLRCRLLLQQGGASSAPWFQPTFFHVGLMACSRPRIFHPVGQIKDLVQNSLNFQNKKISIFSAGHCRWRANFTSVSLTIHL